MMRLRHVILLVILALLIPTLLDGKTVAATRPAIDVAVIQQLQRTGAADVLIVLRLPSTSRYGLDTLIEHIVEEQEAVLARMDPAQVQVHWRYRTVPGLAARVTMTGLAQLAAAPEVARIYLDVAGHGGLLESVPQINADDLHALGYTGAGVTVAVLDSGVDTDHPDLAGDIIAEHCFTHNACPPNHTNEGTSAEDENGHGTHVTGIITGQGTVAPGGVAPNAQIVAVRVLDANNRGYLSDWIAGVDWVVEHKDEYNIRLINMSLSSDATYEGICDGEDPLMATTIENARQAGILTFASSGNNGYASRLTDPACISSSVAVGSVGDGSWGSVQDQISSFSNSNAFLNLLAPGERITGPALGGGSATGYGTSQATAHATGAAALLLSINPGLGPDEIQSALTTTGVLITDDRNGLSFPRVDALAAANTIETPTPTATPTATPSPTPTATSTPSSTPSATPTATPTATPSPTPSPTPTATSTPSSTPSATPTATPTATPSPTPSPTPTATSTLSVTPSPTPTATSTPFCRGSSDLDCDGDVDLNDIEQVVEAWYTPDYDPSRDVDNDGDNDIADIQIVASQWTGPGMARCNRSGGRETPPSARFKGGQVSESGVQPTRKPLLDGTPLRCVLDYKPNLTMSR